MNEEEMNLELARLDEKRNIFEVKEKQKEEKIDANAEIVNNIFSQAITTNVQNNEQLKQEMLDTAGKYVETKTQIIKTEVDTEHKKVTFENKADACASYGFNEKTTSIWAINLMSWGYNAMLCLWLLIGTFTFMPVIFITKKISVAVKSTWLALVFALILYLGITFVPILINLLR